jgi:hypothetical protein
MNLASPHFSALLLLSPLYYQYFEHVTVYTTYYLTELPWKTPVGLLVR